MLRKISICAFAAVSMCTAAFAQNEVGVGSNQNTMSSTQMSARTMPKLTRDNAEYMHWRGDRAVVEYYAARSLNAGHQFDLWRMFRNLSGTEADVMAEAISGAVERNVDQFISNYDVWILQPSMGMNSANMPMNTTSTVILWPSSTQVRRVNDAEAADLLMSTLDASERTVVAGIWDELEMRQRDAIIRLIQESTITHANRMKFASWGMNW